MSGFQIIQGGMGVGVSGWPLARAVALSGQLGVVSGTGLAITLTRRLQLGDADGSVRQALEAFPLPDVVDRVLDRYFIQGGKAEGAPFKLPPMPRVKLGRALSELTVLANFTEVFLAKRDHSGLIGINLLEKLQTTTLASLYGAMLAGVDYVQMGAGVPRHIPGVLDRLSEGLVAELRIDVDDDNSSEHTVASFDPADLFAGPAPHLTRPRFLAIVSSATLASTLARKSNGRVDGFVVEGASAGGHNAPPRGPLRLSAQGEPVYSERDAIDLSMFRELGLPFYLAGGYAEPCRLADARQAGAAGVQVGTAFAFCEESGIAPDMKARVIDQVLAHKAKVFTDPSASPTGFPLKVLQLDGTLSESGIYQARQRLCDLGFLRRPYRRSDGTVGYRCPAEPVEDYVAKGGDIADTLDRKCVCNALFATIGLPQHDKQAMPEPPLVTAGDDAVRIARFIKPGQRSYTAQDVVNYILTSHERDAHGHA